LHEKGFGVAFLTTQGHSFEPKATVGAEEPEFVDARDRAIFALLKSRAPTGSVVVIGNRYPQQRYGDLVGNGYFEGLNAFTRWSESRGLSIVHLLPLPEYSFHDINQCAPQWFNAGMRNSGICLPTDPSERIQQIKDVESRTPRSVRFANYDAAKVLCPSGLPGCYPVHPASQLPMFRNPDHLSNYGASLLVDDFIDFLRLHGLATTK
jgi:hypothetical protein